jgi:5-methylcytosine-specific restriction protein A
MAKIPSIKPRIPEADLSVAKPLASNRRKPVAGFSYDSARWRRLSRRYRAAHPACEHCEAAGRFSLTEHVDHIVPVADGGAAWDEANFAALCRPCHSLKTADDKAKRKGGRIRLRKGCDADGWPLDPAHHWNRE